jgi:hypothetical protein
MSKNVERHGPMKTVQLVCMDCLGIPFNHKRVDLIRDCEGDQAQNGACPLYSYRMGKRVTLRAFRKYCLYCNANSSVAIESCPVKTCAIYPYRHGKNPALTGINKSGMPKGRFGYAPKIPLGGSQNVSE